MLNVASKSIAFSQPRGLAFFVVKLVDSTLNNSLNIWSYNVQTNYISIDSYFINSLRKQ